jgi:hypothetical protein
LQADVSCCDIRYSSRLRPSGVGLSPIPAVFRVGAGKLPRHQPPPGAYVVMVWRHARKKVLQLKHAAYDKQRFA